MIKNKEITDALCLLLHCSLKDKEYETQKQQFDLIYKYIETLEKHLEFYEKHGSYKERIAELKRQNEIKDGFLGFIYDIGYDYDGCGTVKSLQELIDELMKFARLALENNDKEVMFIGARGREFNILHEELPNSHKYDEMIDKHFDNITPEQFKEAVERCMEGTENE